MATTTLPRARRRVGALFSLGLAAALLSACSTGPDTTASEGAAGSFSGGGEAAAPEAAQDYAVQEESRAQDFDSGEDAMAEVPADGGGSVDADLEAPDRALIHTAHMTVRVDDVTATSEEAKELAITAEGYVASEHVSTPSGGTPNAFLTLRVPNEGYEELLSALAELGDRSDLERSVNDVTEEVTDVESRIESAETSLDTLRGYLEEAENVDELLRVEEQIQRRQSELEAFQARLEALTDQTSYSTIHVRLSPPESYVERPNGEDLGFLGALKQGWEALVAMVLWLLVFLGWVLPFTALAAAIVGPLWWWRRRRRTRAAEETAPAEPSDSEREETEEASGERSSDGE
ncbi:DUF4349 domain-containing protein [Nocardiopsis sp. CNT312]|uniref:DUF4349 domain-containing protein n=1 Tax=Nocardiopsis sp. CNT312 TaxID=1137268 RepID=UPI0004B25AF6|nr:DUF4349 domain-containing protein [Nocardiopsis sp. CNT312]